MMNKLEMPKASAGGGIESEKAIGEQILTDAVSAPEIERSGTRGHVDHTAVLIERHAGPTICSTNMHPGIRRPGLRSGFARVRDCVEGPDDFAGADVISTEMTG